MNSNNTVTAKMTINPYLKAHCRFISYMSEKFPLHDHDFYEIFLIAKGRIEHLINDKTEILEEGSLVFIRPKDCHFYQAVDNQDCLYINFKFQADLFDSLIEYFSIKSFKEELLSSDMPMYVKLNSYEKEKLYKKFEKLNDVPAQDITLYKNQMRNFLIYLVMNYFYGNSGNTSESLPEWMEQMCSEIKKEKRFLDGIEAMVELSGKSHEHLSRCFKKYLNTTPTEYINQIKLNYAANLLAHTDMKIIDISMECGFYSLSYFYKIFREKYGVSAAQYRSHNHLL